MSSPAPVLLFALAFVLTACGGAADTRPDDGGVRPEAMRLYTEAGLLAQAGRLEEAAERYDEVTRIDPESVHVWLAAARTRGRMGQWDEAISRAQAAVRLDGDTGVARAALGELYAAAGRPEEARTLYRESVERRPEDTGSWMRLAETSLLLGDADEAERALRRLLQIDERDADAWERLGRLLARQGRPAHAAEAYERARGLDAERVYLDREILTLALDGGDVPLARGAARRLAGDLPADRAVLLLPTQLAKRDDLFGAVSELELALRENPNNAHARLMLATLLARVGRLEDAARALVPVKLDGPVGVDALRLAAFLASKAGDHPGAMAKLDAAADLAPDEPEIELDAVGELYRHKRLPEARARAEAAIGRWPRHVEIHYLLGMILQESGEEAAATREMEGVLQIDGEHAGALNFVGYALAQRGEQLEKAELLIRRALDHRPDDGAIVDSLGWVLFRRGRLEEAEEALGRAVELSPAEAEIRFHLAEVLLAAGQRARALAAFEEAVRLVKEPRQRREYQRRLEQVRGRRR